MALEDIRQRTRYLFLVVILGHILLISAQVNSRRGVPMLEAVTFGIFSEVQRSASSAVSGRRNVWSGRIDRDAAAGALIERSRAQGVVVGSGEERLRMEYVSEVADVVVGDIVVTSGIDGLYPKGFIIGRVEAVEKTGPTFKRISVRPAV